MDLGRRTFTRERDGDAARPGAKVEDARSERDGRGASERDVDQRFGVGPRNEHPSVDAKDTAIEFTLAEQVGDGLADPTPFPELSKLRELRGHQGPLGIDDQLDARRLQREGE